MSPSRGSIAIAHHLAVSVVIPTFNRKDLVCRAIDSVLAQTVSPREIVVVDDGSIDGTAESLQKYGQRIRYIHQPNAGVSAARNRGCESSDGDVVAFLDSDDEWLPRMVEVQTAALERFPAAVASAANAIIRTVAGDEDLFEIRGIECAEKSQVAQLTGILGALHQPVTSGIMIRRAALERTGGFDVAVREYEDFDLWSRLSLHGGWVFCAEPLWVHYRDVLDETNVSQQYWVRPLEAYRSLFHSHERLLGIEKRRWGETFRLRHAIGHYRCLVGALARDQGLPGGLRETLKSALDWPSPRRVARAVAVAAGWRPREIREHSQRLRAEPKVIEVARAQQRVT